MATSVASHSPSHSEDDDSASDAKSDSSSIMYDHEPFVTFQDRVVDLATSAIWTDADRDAIQVERLSGGSYNRVIGVRRKRDGEEGEEDDDGRDGQDDLILRVPRFDADRMDQEVAILRFVAHQTDIPMPRVVSFDLADNNPIASRYMIQTRIPGTVLLSTFPSLHHKDKCRVARELGAVYRSLLAVRSSRAGIPDLVTASEDADGESAGDDAQDASFPGGHIAPFAILSGSDNKASATKSTPAQPVGSVYELMTSLLHAQKAACLAHCPTDTAKPELFDQLCHMTFQLQNKGYLTNDHFCLAHLDLEPHNILLATDTDTADQDASSTCSTPPSPGPCATNRIITGVLDWDSAILGPMFMACKPPMWIWGWLHDEEEDERLANDEPTTPEGRQLKQCFETAAGPDYVKFAYPTAYRLARRLFYFAMKGIGYNEHWREAEHMLEEWSCLS